MTAPQVFNVAQAFLVDPGSVQNAPEIHLTGVDLYFQRKPSATANRSRIPNPGVTVFVCETTGGVPDTSRMLGQPSRVEYASIATSTTAATATRFSFAKPVRLPTGRMYAFVVRYDGDEDFGLWRSREGETIVGQSNRTAGPAGQYVGNFYEFASVSANTTLGGQWKPLSTTDLKFRLHCARWTMDEYANVQVTNAVTGQTETRVVGRKSYVLSKDPIEFIVYEREYSGSAANVVGGELVYQNAVQYPTTVAVRSDSAVVTSSQTNFTSVFGTTGSRYVLLVSGSERALRQVTNVNSNGAVLLDRPPPFTNGAARFQRVVVGRVASVGNTSVFGRSENMMVLIDSNANSSLRFVNNTVEGYTIVASGTGYQNTDYLVVYGGGANGTNAEVNAVANVTTDASGNIVSLTWTNKGIGFLEPSPAYRIANSTGGEANSRPAVTVSANLTFNIGSWLHGSVSNVAFANCRVVNLGVNRVSAAGVGLSAPPGTGISLRYDHLYTSDGTSVMDALVTAAGTGYANGDRVTFSGDSGTGAVGYVVTDSAGRVTDVSMIAGGSGYSDPTASITTSGGSGATLEPIIGTFRFTEEQAAEFVENAAEIFRTYPVPPANTPLVLSRSVEVAYANVSYTTDTGVTGNTNVSSIVQMVLETNNVFTLPDVSDDRVDVFVERYSINDDYTGEETGQGRALAKGISKRFTFANNRVAEDIVVDVRAFRPANTDVRVYAKLHSAKDSEPFEDKDWTLLEMVDGIGRYSNPTNEDDVVEYRYTLPQSPNTASTLAGTVTTNANTRVTGAGTAFDTALAVDDLVKIYSPTFANNYEIGVVASVTNSTVFDLKTALSNNNVIGVGFKVDLISYKHQAFFNRNNGFVARYYDGAMGEHDGFSSYAIKIVMLSESDTVVPKIDDSRGVGVTA